MKVISRALLQTAVTAPSTLALFNSLGRRSQDQAHPVSGWPRRWRQHQCRGNPSSRFLSQARPVIAMAEGDQFAAV